jgi:hypothetical protein
MEIAMITLGRVSEETRQPKQTALEEPLGVQFRIQ